MPPQFAFKEGLQREGFGTGHLRLESVLGTREPERAGLYSKVPDGVLANEVKNATDGNTLRTQQGTMTACRLNGLLRPPPALLDPEARSTDKFLLGLLTQLVAL